WASRRRTEPPNVQRLNSLPDRLRLWRFTRSRRKPRSIIAFHQTASEPEGHLNDEIRDPLVAPPRPEHYVAVVDFGSQYTQLIARRIREAHVYCEILPHDRGPRDFGSLKGVILSGGPASVYDPGAPRLPTWLREADVPVLSICYGMQLIAHEEGGAVERAAHREYGPARIRVAESDHDLFRGLPDSLDV